MPVETASVPPPLDIPATSALASPAAVIESVPIGAGCDMEDACPSTGTTQSAGDDTPASTIRSSASYQASERGWTRPGPTCTVRLIGRAWEGDPRCSCDDGLVWMIAAMSTTLVDPS